MNRINKTWGNFWGINLAEYCIKNAFIDKPLGRLIPPTFIVPLCFPVGLVSHRESSPLAWFCETILLALSKMPQFYTIKYCIKKPYWPFAFESLREPLKMHSLLSPLDNYLSLNLLQQFSRYHQLCFFWVQLQGNQKWSTVEYSIFKSQKAIPCNKKKVIEIWTLSQATLVTQELCFLSHFVPSDMISSISQ